MKWWIPLFCVSLLCIQSCNQKELRAQYYFIRSAAIGDTIGRFYVHETEDEQVRLDWAVSGLLADTLYQVQIRSGKANNPGDTLLDWGLVRTTGTSLNNEKIWDRRYDDMRVLDACFFLNGPAPWLSDAVAFSNLGKNR